MTSTKDAVTRLQSLKMSCPRVLGRVKLWHNPSIGRTKTYIGLPSPEALSNTVADSLGGIRTGYTTSKQRTGVCHGTVPAGDWTPPAETYGVVLP